MKDRPVILVVDDEPQNIDLLEALLYAEDYVIISAGSGEEALEKLTGNRINLMLLDIMMPDINGFEVIRRVRQNIVYQHLPIIMITVLKETEDRVKGIEAGCDDFISKPIDKLELIARIRSLLKIQASNDLMINYQKELELTKKSTDIALEYADSIINTIREPLIALDQDLRVVSVSRSFYEFFRVRPEETVGQLIYDLGNKQWDIPKLRELLETILPQETTFDNYEVEHDFATIGKRIMLLNARRIQQALGKERIILLAIEDVTERKQFEEKIQHMAFHDSLTGLPNRKLFADRLSIALTDAQRNQKKVGIAMLDLDKFKDVNDTLGHDVGDGLIKITATLLTAALRKGDTVARFGGDEFVLILSDVEEIEDVIHVAEKIVGRFREPLLVNSCQLVVTTSIGLAIYPNDGLDESTLLKNADIAMYQAKKSGQNQYKLYGKR